MKENVRSRGFICKDEDEKRGDMKNWAGAGRDLRGTRNYGLSLDFKEEALCWGWELIDYLGRLGSPPSDL